MVDGQATGVHTRVGTSPRSTTRRAGTSLPLDSPSATSSTSTPTLDAASPLLSLPAQSPPCRCVPQSAPSAQSELAGATLPEPQTDHLVCLRRPLHLRSSSSSISPPSSRLAHLQRTLRTPPPGPAAAARRRPAAASRPAFQGLQSSPPLPSATRSADPRSPPHADPSSRHQSTDALHLNDPYADYVHALAGIAPRPSVSTWTGAARDGYGTPYGGAAGPSSGFAPLPAYLAAHVPSYALGGHGPQQQLGPPAIYSQYPHGVLDPRLFNDSPPLPTTPGLSASHPTLRSSGSPDYLTPPPRPS